MLSRKDFLALCSQYSIGTSLLSKLPIVSLLDRHSELPPLTPDIFRDSANTGTFIPLDSFINYQLIRKDDVTAHMMIFAYEFDLTPGFLGNDKDVTIFSYKTIINGNIEIIGRNVFLLTNQLLAKNNATFSVSGSNGRTFSGGPPILTNCNWGPVVDAPPSKNVGEDGTQQDDRTGSVVDNHLRGQMNGGNAGDLFVSFQKFDGAIILTANGGNGGKGQDGSNGREGCPADPHSNPPGYHYGNSGSNGGTGAPGGYGGNAGRLLTGFDPTQFPVQITLSNTHGVQGDSGTPGVGGKLSRGYFDRGFPQKDPDDPQANKHKVQIDGFDGKAATLTPNDHTRDGAKSTIGTVNFYQYIPVDFVLLLLLKADSLFLNSSYSTPDDPNLLANLLIFIYTTAISNADKGFYDHNNAANIKSFFFFQDQDKYNGEKYDALWNAIAVRAKGHLTKLRLGLDFFGNPPNYAPNLNFDFLQSKFNPNKDFENFYEKVTNEQLVLQRTNITNTVNKTQAMANIAELTQDIKNCIDTINRINVEVNERYQYIDILKNGLGKDDIEFRQAVEAQGGGCSLAVMIDVIVAVVAIAATIYTLGTTSEVAVASIGTLAGDVAAVGAIDDLAKVVTDIKDLSDKVQKVEDSFNKLKQTYNSFLHPDPKAPTTLLNVDKADFDKMINSFLDLPAAQKYKADYHVFIDYVDATNKLRLQITANIMAINTAFETIAILNTQINAFDTTLVSNQVTTLSNAEKLSIFSLYNNTKLVIAQQVYLQQKALAYQYPATPPPAINFDTLSIETLAAPYFMLANQSLINFDGNSFHTPADFKALGINFADFPHSMATFPKPIIDSGNNKNYYLFEFNIAPPLDNGSGNLQHSPLFLKLADFFDSTMYNIKVMGVQLAINSQTPQPKRITARLYHRGDSLVTTKPNFQGQKLFRHSAKEIDKLTSSLKANNKPSVFNTDTKTNLVGGALSGITNTNLGVSPFATWQLKIHELDNQSISSADLLTIVKSLTSIDLYFWYYYQV